MDIFLIILILVQDEKPIEKLKVSSNTCKKAHTYNNLFEDNFFKLIPLDKDKILYCNYYFVYQKTYGEGVSCGIAQVKNNLTIEIIKTSELLFNYMSFS